MGPGLRVILEGSCLRARPPPVDMRAVCLVRAIRQYIRSRKKRSGEKGATDAFVGRGERRYQLPCNFRRFGRTRREAAIQELKARRVAPLLLLGTATVAGPSNLAQRITSDAYLLEGCFIRARLEHATLRTVSVCNFDISTVPELLGVDPGPGREARPQLGVPEPVGGSGGRARVAGLVEPLEHAVFADHAAREAVVHFVCIDSG